MELNRIYNEDCLEGMRRIPDGTIDLVVTDPPYIFTPHGGGQSALAKRARRLRDDIDFMANDFNADAVFSEFMRVAKTPNFIIFCSNKQISRTMSWFENKGLPTTLLVWKKTNPSPLGNMNYISDLEFIVYVRSKGSTFNSDVPLDWKLKCYQSALNKEIDWHPSAKPTELLRRYLLIHSNKNDTILDPFMGSGSTAIACIRERRNFIGFELNKEYYDKACKRIANEQAQASLF